MKKRHAAAICGFLLILLQCTFAVDAETKEMVSVTMLKDQKLLSIDAQNTAVDVIIKSLAEQSNVKIKIGGKGLPAVPLTVHYKDLTIKEALQKILRAAGVTNYVLDAKYDASKQLTAVDCQILTCNTNGRTDMLPPAEYGKTVAAAETPTDNHTIRVENFQQKYTWANDEVSAMAGHLLTIMPEQIRDNGFSALEKILDEKKKNNAFQSIDEDVLIQSIMDTAPPEMAFLMKVPLELYIKGFKGMGDGITEKTPKELYEEAFANSKQPAI
jgi:hypothetical protein